MHDNKVLRHNLTIGEIDVKDNDTLLILARGKGGSESESLMKNLQSDYQALVDQGYARDFNDTRTEQEILREQYIKENTINGVPPRNPILDKHFLNLPDETDAASHPDRTDQLPDEGSISWRLASPPFDYI